MNPKIVAATTFLVGMSRISVSMVPEIIQPANNASDSMFCSFVED